MKTANEILDKHLAAMDICCDRESGYIDDYGVYPLIENAMEVYANQSKWISVKDRLPKTNGHYLIYDMGYEIALFSNGLWKTLDKVEKGVLSDFRSTLKPTHWQPLPKKP